MEKNEVGDLPGIDGVDHINFYSRGATDLGKLGSHFAYTPFNHPEFGSFSSLEAFWYWVKLEDRESADADKLRKLHGYAAKEFGKTLQAVEHLVGFQRHILKANWFKFVQHHELREMMIESTLPFNHYYVVGGGKVMVRPNGFDWLIDGWEKIRAELKLRALKPKAE